MLRFMGLKRAGHDLVLNCTELNTVLYINYISIRLEEKNKIFSIKENKVIGEVSQEKVKMEYNYIINFPF